MKKKIIAALLVLMINFPAFASYLDKQLKETKKNAKYNTTQIHQERYINPLGTNSTQKLEIKDPKLISLPSVTPVNKKDYENKLLADEKIYNTKIKNTIYKKTDTINVNPEAIDFYAIYRVGEKLIRANNLDYMNWRIAIRKSEDFNASSYEGNYIRINTALYDTFYDNDDALAFVIAHEIAHHLFGHAQRRLDREKLNNSVGTGLICAAMPLYAIYMQKKDVNEDRVMEYMADTEALKLLIHAGYDPKKSIDALTFMESLPNVQDFYGSHPLPKDRIKNIQESVVLANPNWVEMGKVNIYNTPVLDCKKSSDRVSIIINRNKETKNFYKAETPEEYLTRVAYLSYKSGNMKNAIKYFKALHKLDNSYVSALYTSLAYEYLYNKTQNKSFESKAEKYKQLAKSLAPTL